MKSYERKHAEAFGYILARYNAEALEHIVNTKQFEEMFDIFIKYMPDIEYIFRQDQKRNG